VNAREKIERLVFLYAELLDGGELDQLAALFKKGRIVVDGQPQAMEGSEQVKQTLARYTCFYDEKGKRVDRLLQPGRPFTRHITSNLFFQELHEEKALVHSCFSVLQGLPGEEIKIVISGRYIDQFRCEAGDWFFSERREIIDLIGDLSQHLSVNPF
jgi:3-phenylpropionate/cinnamic acid dioxygenase small subunit